MPKQSGHRAGLPIKRIVIGARSTHFCSFCQRLSAADREGSKTILRGMTGGQRRRGRRWTDLDGGGQDGGAGRPRAERTRTAGGTPRITGTAAHVSGEGSLVCRPLP